LRFPFARYGMRELTIFAGGLFAAAVAAAVAAALMETILLIWVAAVLFALAVWVLLFFRDPHRRIPDGESLLVAPADGKVVDVSEGPDAVMGCECVKVGIFLSIFNVHINRAPVDGKVSLLQYRKGRFLNAVRSVSAAENEANLMVLSLDDNPSEKIGVRQIAGTIARRIVCEAEVGDTVCRGEKYGMIKFGSRTELLIPVTLPCEILVGVGQKVKAGQTPVARFL